MFALWVDLICTENIYICVISFLIIAGLLGESGKCGLVQENSWNNILQESFSAYFGISFERIRTFLYEKSTLMC